MQSSFASLLAIALLGVILLVPLPALGVDPFPSSLDDPPSPSHDVSLPLNFVRRTGDLDEMVKRRTIRARVVLNPLGFFYDEGLPRGAMYEALEAFESFVNGKLRTRATEKVEVTFLPVRLDQLEAALTTGMGDIIAYDVAITPDRERRVAFSMPIRKGVSEIVVTGTKYESVSPRSRISAARRSTSTRWPSTTRPCRR
jgi:ABC-type amino acid transport substrate-binding protein